MCMYLKRVRAYCTSRSSDRDILKPSSWLITRLQRDLLLRPLTSSREEAEAGKQKVMFFYNENTDTTRRWGDVKAHTQSSCHGVCLCRRGGLLPESEGPGRHGTSCDTPWRLPFCPRRGGSSGCELWSAETGAFKSSPQKLPGVFHIGSNDCTVLVCLTSTGSSGVSFTSSPSLSPIFVTVETSTPSQVSQSVSQASTS